MQIVSTGDNLHEMSDLFSGKNMINLSSTEYAQRVVKVNGEVRCDTYFKSHGENDIDLQKCISEYCRL